MRSITSRLLTALVCTLALVAGTVQAQSPGDIVRILTAFPPGGSSDLLARILAESLSTELNKPVIVESRPGGNGAIAANALLSAKADGRTIWLTTAGAVSINPELYPKLSYDVNRLAPVSLVAGTPEVLVISSKNPATDAAAFLSSAGPNQMPTIASSGIGSMPHMAIALFSDSTGVAFNHIAQKGAAPAINDVLGGHVGGFFGDVSAVMPFIKSGGLRPIGITAKTRHPLLPDVKTFDEMGMKGMHLNNWSAIFVSKETPQDVVDQLNQAINRAVKSPAMQQRLATQGIQAEGSTPAQLSDLVRGERAHWKQVIQRHKIKPE